MAALNALHTIHNGKKCTLASPPIQYIILSLAPQLRPFRVDAFYYCVVWAPHSHKDKVLSDITTPLSATKALVLVLCMCVFDAGVDSKGFQMTINSGDPVRINLLGMTNFFGHTLHFLSLPLQMQTCLNPRVIYGVSFTSNQVHLSFDNSLQAPAKYTCTNCFLLPRIIALRVYPFFLAANAATASGQTGRHRLAGVWWPPAVPLGARHSPKTYTCAAFS